MEYSTMIRPAPLNAVAMEVTDADRVDQAIPWHKLLHAPIELLQRNGQLAELGGLAHNLERGARRVYACD